MKRKAYAKINLILDVLNKREDGFHNINFLMTTIDLYDTVEVILDSKDSIEVINNDALNQENNLAYKALKLLKAKFPIENSYKIIIKKNIPIAAGMAGGSADCAAVLHLLNDLENLGLSNQDLAKIGIELGSDVAFCIYSCLSHVTGMGEKIKVLNDKIPKSSVLVINSRDELSTKDVYTNYKYKKNKKKPIEEIVKLKDYDKFYQSLRNDLEPISKELDPKIKQLENFILDQFKVSKIIVSGSGPTLLVFDRDYQKLNNIRKKINENYKYKKYYVEIHKIL